MAKKNNQNPFTQKGTPVGNKKSSNSIAIENQDNKPLLGNNFILILIAAAMIIIGFALIGGSSSTVEQYNADIFSTRRIVIGPTISFLGFVLMAVAIIVKPRACKKDK